MAELGRATIKIDADTTSVESTCRIIAKHFTALADALREDQISSTGPAPKPLTPEGVGHLQTIREAHFHNVKAGL
jgi:hypothetical protein